MQSTKQNVIWNDSTGKIHGKNKNAVINFSEYQFLKTQAVTYNQGEKYGHESSKHRTCQGNRKCLSPLSIAEQLCIIFECKYPRQQINPASLCIQSLVEGHDDCKIKRVDTNQNHDDHDNRYKNIKSDISLTSFSLFFLFHTFTSTRIIRFRKLVLI